jgi:hypothetical protein
VLRERERDTQDIGKTIWKEKRLRQCA